MEDISWHATLISDITDHTKCMDKDTVYAAFMPFVVVVVVAAEFVLFAFFHGAEGGSCLFLGLSDQQCQSLVIRLDITFMVNWALINENSFLPLISQLYSFYGLTDNIANTTTRTLDHKSFLFLCLCTVN